MTQLQLGLGAYKRGFGREPDVKLENRFLESDPTNLVDQVALLSRPGSKFRAGMGAGPIRATYTQRGTFKNDLFVVSGDALYRLNDDGSKIAISGVVDLGSDPQMVIVAGTGFEHLWITDGKLLQYYDGADKATGTLSSQGGIGWTERVTPADNRWWDIEWSPELGLFAAVAFTGTGNRVMTSTDGITWTIRTTPVDNQWRGITWSPELGIFVAVALTGTGNRAMTSPDGITWTVRSSAADNTWRRVAWSPELGLFAAVSDNGAGNRVMTSPDGITWTSRTTPADNRWTSIVWSPELGIFVSTALDGVGNRVMTSSDGITWSIQSTPVDNQWSGLAWSPELGIFVATALSGIGNRVMTSIDGATWTARTTPANNSWREVAWSPELGLFAVISNTGTGNRAMTSPDGITWTLRTTPVDNNWRSIAWSPELGLFAAVADSGTGNRVMTSPGKLDGGSISIGATHYDFASNPTSDPLADGSTSNPWQVKIGADNLESFSNLEKAVNLSGIAGVDYSLSLTKNSQVLAKDATRFNLDFEALVAGSAGNSIATSASGTVNLGWGAATLESGGGHSLKGAEIPSGKGAVALDSLVQFVIVSTAEEDRFYYVEPGAVVVQPLDFATAEKQADKIIDVVTVGAQVWLVGETTLEPWYPTGDAANPFAPIQGRTLSRGALLGTPVRVNESLVLVGDDNRVYTVQGSPVPISTHGIEERIREARKLIEEAGL